MTNQRRVSEIQPVDQQHQIVGIERPAMREHNGRAGATILKEELGTIFHRQIAHGVREVSEENSRRPAHAVSARSGQHGFG
jgi:hypothetical protein